MQRLDSDIAEAVMVDLYAQDIVVLPIHDSFIVRRGFEGYLKSAMNRAYQKYVAAIPGMKADHQELTLEEWEQAKDPSAGIISGAEAMAIFHNTVGKYEGYKKREHQWRQNWGLVGWD